MTSREIIKAVLEFGNPPRIGMTLPPPYPNDHIGSGRTPGNSLNESLQPHGNEVRRWRDEWGCVWATLTNHDKGEVVEGAIEDWSQLETYQPPDLGRMEDYHQAAHIFKDDRNQHYRLGYIPGCTFNVARYIRRMENYLCDLVVERENIGRLHTLVRRELLKAIDCLAAAGADGIMFPEDWGTQDRLMVSPAMWRDIFKPEFQAICSRAHHHGMTVWMHSCGKITDIIEDLIECGVDVLQFDQFCLHGIDTLAERFGGRVTFWGPVDIQKTLQTRDPIKIEAQARELVQKLSRGGGFIAGYYGSNEAIGITPEVQDIACRAFHRIGTFREGSQ